MTPPLHHKDLVRTLKEAASAWFEARGCTVRADPRYAYVLADRRKWAQNIILPEVADHIRQERVPLHKNVHSGLSSQAMLFNLVGPLVVEGDLEPLRSAFAARGIEWPAGEVTAAFEYEDRAVFNEPRQPTSIDLALKDGNGAPRVFVECKLSEREFGGCSAFKTHKCDGCNPADDFARCYLHRRGNRYWDILGRLGFLAGAFVQKKQCPLARHYQFFREVLFALKLEGVFVLLCDARNPFFADPAKGDRGLMASLLSLVPQRFHARIRVVSIQQVIAAVRESGRHDRWVGEFARKYGLGRIVGQGA